MLKPGSPRWHSAVEAPLFIDDPERTEWADSADVVVVGFGGAGVIAALEARETGADVLAIDRFEGGGATALSGGVYYGGGTKYQREAGYDDTPEEMFKYLKLETRGVVSDGTLRQFCDQSAANLDWLESQGLRFSGSLSKAKRSYPPEENYLYFSGNELVAGYRDLLKPAPRGHRVYGPGFTGGLMYQTLKASALGKGVRLMPHSPVMRLVLDRQGAVQGVEVRQLPPGSRALRQHRRLIRVIHSGLNLVEPVLLRAVKKSAAIIQKHGERRLIRARRGVVLSAGSFSVNRSMVQDYAPLYAAAMPLGSVGCDGSGIRLGQSVQAAIGEMDRVSAWRSISPPECFIKGMVVDSSGIRFVTEDSYLGRLGEQVALRLRQRAWLVIDRPLYWQAWKEVWPTFKRGSLNAFFSLSVPLLINLLFNTRRGRTIELLAGRCGIAAAPLRGTLDTYNQGAREGRDALGKAQEYLRMLEGGPYYAIDISIGSKLNPCPSIPMGGLKVDETTGQVLREDGSRISGLFAAGRNAVGICSRFYVSGTSIADCVFSGRRAGRAAALSTRQDNAMGEISAVA